jgi:electron transfer flavoprotein alpha subunit
MATIRPGVFPVDFYENHQAELIYFNQVLNVKPSVEILNIEKTEKSHTDLTKAKLIVAGGRGVQKSFSTLKDIASLVGGELAASRAIVDQAIEPKDRLVGQTGTTVRPQVYLASGISGAIQHVSGMDKSELIIAINTDPDALIFDIADVSIISDANQVLPILKEELSHQHQHE